MSDLISPDLRWAMMTVARRLVPEPMRSCNSCGASPGQVHKAHCYVERCSHCGQQAICCGSEKHDPVFSRWSGFYPGSLEADALGISMNEFFECGYHKILFVKPKPPSRKKKKS